MNIINKTLLPIQNVPEGGATIDVRVYNIETEMYLEGTALANSYTITPNKPSYEAGETVSILLKNGLGTSAERTFQKTLVEGVNVIELAYSGNFLKLIAYPSEIGVQPYNIAIAPLNRYIRASSSDTISKIARVYPVGTLSGTWMSNVRAYNNITINIPSGSTLMFLNPTTSTFITPYLGTNTTRRIIDWGNFKPNTVTIESPFNIKPLEGEQIFPTKLPSIWTSLNSILYNVEGVYDVPSTWDLSNITNIMGIMKGKKDISTFPSNLFVKSYQNMQSAFSDCTFTEDVDLSLIDYSETTNLRNFNYQTNPMTTPSYYAEYYDKMLKKWVETIDPSRSLTVHMHSKYSSIGEEYRNILLDRGWVINDLGLGEYITVNITTSPSQGNFTISGEKTLYRVGDEITIEGQSEGFISKTQTYTLVEGVNNINFALDADELNLSVTTNPSDANITVTYTPNKPFYTYGETVTITVDSDMYASQTRTVTVTNLNQVEHFVLVRDRYTLTPTSTLNNVTFTLTPNKVAYYPNEIVTIVASKNGYLSTTKQVKMESNHMTVEVNPVNESDAFEVEFEYVPEVTSYGVTLNDDPTTHSMVYFGSEKAYDKDTFTKEELIDAGAIENGRIKLRFLPSDNLSTIQRYITSFSRFYVNIPAGNGYATKIWINTMPSWVRIKELVHKLDLQYCAEPLDSNLLLVETLGWGTEFSRYAFLFSMIGRGVNSGLKFSAISHWDFSRFTDFSHLFFGSYIDFNIGLMNLNFYRDNMQAGSHFFGFINDGMIVDPAKYDDFLHSLLGSGISRELDCGISKYTPYGNIARQQLVQGIDIIDGGMVDPLTYPLVLNINVPIDTLTKTPNKSQYEVGETVQLFITKNGYEDYSYTHTIQKYRENNILDITMVEKTYFPTVIVRDDQNNIIPNATITLTPNKQSYLVGEEVLVSATKDGYSIDERYHTIVDGDNTVNLILTDISMDITYTVGTSGTPSMSFYLMNDIPVKITNFDGTETLYGTDEPYRVVLLTGTIPQGTSTTIKIKPIGIGNVGIANISFSPTGNNGLSYRNTISIEKWGRVTHASALAYLFAESAGNIAKIPMLPNTNEFDYLFYGLTGDQGTNKPYVANDALSEWTNVAIGTGRYMFASTINLPLDPRGFDLTYTTDISNIYDSGTIAPINGQNAYDLWLIHLTQNYLNKALSIKVSMKYTSVGETARQQLVNAGWTISDLGLEIPNTLVVNTTPSDATITLNPNQASYQVGDVVTITVSKQDYVTQTINHTIVQGVNTVDVVLELDSTDMVMRYTKEGGTGLFTFEMRNPSTSITTKNVMSDATLSFTPTSSFTNRSLGNLSTSTITNKEVRLVQSTNPNATDTYVYSIRVPTVANGGKLDILSWGNFNYPDLLTLNLVAQGKVGRIVPPKNTSSLNYFFSKNSNNDYSEADFSDWNGVQIQIAQRMFNNHTLLNFDPRMLDLTLATDIRNIFAGTTLAPINGQNAYDLWLIHLNENYRTKNLTFTYGGKYTSAGASARASLISSGWTITDGGLEA